MRTTNDLSRSDRAVVLAVRRHQAQQPRDQLRRLEAFHGQCCELGATLATNPWWDVCGARSALVEPLQCVMERTEDAVGAWESVLAVATADINSISDLSSTSTHLAAALQEARRHRGRLFIGMLAWQEAVLLWRLRAEQWRTNWPVTRAGNAVRLPDLPYFRLVQPLAPDWVTAGRRAMIMAAHSGLTALEEHRRVCRRLAARLTTSSTFIGSADGDLLEHAGQQLAAMPQALAAAFRLLVLLTNVDVADENLAEQWPADCPASYRELANLAGPHPDAVPVP